MRTVSFTCSICGERSSVTLDALDRETPSCRTCGSTVRWRAIVLALSHGLLGDSVPLTEFPVRKDLRGVGLSDWPGYADRLAERFDYRNTFLDREPELDIAADVDAMRGTLDFLIASDVLEHVPPPISRAFANTRALLKPGGLLVLSVPFSLEGDTLEHFPRLHRYTIVDVEGHRVLVNLTADGQWETHQDLVFHGGDGLTLEMRLFSRRALLRHLESAGFVDLVEHDRDRLEWGIRSPVPCSYVISARAPLAGVEPVGSSPRPVSRHP